MPAIPTMPFPTFEAFYAAESSPLARWLERNRVSDPDAIVQQAFLQVFRSRGFDPAAWTRAYLYQVVRGLLHERHERNDRLALQSLDVETAGGEGDPLAATIAAPEAPEHGPVIEARLSRVKHELRRMPARMRAAFAIPTIYGKSNSFAADLLDRSVTRVDHLRQSARLILDATFGGGAPKLTASLLLPTPDCDELETPIRPRPLPRLCDDGSIEICLAKPRQLDTHPECHAIVHLAGTDGDRSVFASDPCPVEWIENGDDRWHLRLRPRFDKVAPVGASLIGLWLFAGDWLAGA
ncbi:MAG: sigma-70 family RNA polymerase sigma factor [Planctomycetota bacterium]